MSEHAREATAADTAATAAAAAAAADDHHSSSRLDGAVVAGNTDTTTDTSAAASFHRHHRMACGRFEYSLADTLGRGSFAEVFKGYSETDEPVAIKRIDRSRLRKKANKRLLQQEVTVLKAVEHPNIVRFYEVQETAEHVCLIMEYCDGGDLATLISRAAPMPEVTVACLMQQLASALRHLRERGVVHRDLKPSNLLLATNINDAGNGGDDGGSGDNNSSSLGHCDTTTTLPCIKVADFGFARELAEEDMAATFCGSPLYMAPEVLEGGEYGAGADLWSVGAICYECLTGRPPFKAPSIKALKKLFLTQGGRFHMPRGASPACSDLLRGLLQPNPEKRISHEAFFRHPFVQGTAAAAAAAAAKNATASTTTPAASKEGKEAEKKQEQELEQQRGRQQGQQQSPRPFYGTTPRTPSPSLSGDSSGDSLGESGSRDRNGGGVGDIVRGGNVGNSNRRRDSISDPESVVIVPEISDISPSSRRRTGVQESFVVVNEAEVQVNMFADAVQHRVNGGDTIKKPVSARFGPPLSAPLATMGEAGAAIVGGLVEGIGSGLLGLDLGGGSGGGGDGLGGSNTRWYRQQQQRRLVQQQQQQQQQQQNQHNHTLNYFAASPTHTNGGLASGSGSGDGVSPLTEAAVLAEIERVLEPATEVMAVANSHLEGGTGNSPPTRSRQLQALMLLRRSLAIFRGGIQGLCGVATRAPKSLLTPEVSESVQRLRDRFNTCLRRVETLRQAVSDPDAVAVPPGGPLFSTEEILYEHAVALCRSAAQDERSGVLDMCEVTYSRALVLLRLLLRDAEGDDDRRVLHEYEVAAETRLQAVRRVAQERAIEDAKAHAAAAAAAAPLPVVGGVGTTVFSGRSPFDGGDGVGGVGGGGGGGGDSGSGRVFYNAGLHATGRLSPATASGGSGSSIHSLPGRHSPSATTTGGSFGVGVGTGNGGYDAASHGSSGGGGLSATPPWIASRRGRGPHASSPQSISSPGSNSPHHQMFMGTSPPPVAARYDGVVPAAIPFRYSPSTSPGETTAQVYMRARSPIPPPGGFNAAFYGRGVEMGYSNDRHHSSQQIPQQQSLGQSPTHAATSSAATSGRSPPQLAPPRPGYGYDYGYGYPMVQAYSPPQQHQQEQHYRQQPSQYVYSQQDLQQHRQGQEHQRQESQHQSPYYSTSRYRDAMSQPQFENDGNGSI